MTLAAQPGDTLSLLPSSATAYMTAMSMTSARILDTDTDAIRREKNPSICDFQFVPFLAWERSVHYYKAADEAGNRRRIATSFVDHTLYGSPAALEAEISLDVGFSVQIVEFFEDPALVWPYFYIDVLVSPGAALPDGAAIWKSAIFRKNVRDMPAAIRARLQQLPANVYAGAATCFGISIETLPQNAPKPPPQMYVGAATCFIVSSEILPQRAS